MKSFLIALQFLTRIPIQLRDIPNEKETARSLLYYPLVGLLIGVFLFALNLSLTNADDMLRAALILSAWVIITGALHLDGLADSADAWAGGFGDKTKTLTIMKDPYCGPVGVVTLLLVLLLKFSVIINLNHENAYLLIIVPVLARASVLWAFLSIPYAKKQGLGAAFTRHLSRRNNTVLLLGIAFIVLITVGWHGVILLISLSMVFYFLKYLVMKRIGGITGDTLGAQIEIIETVLLITGALLI